MESKFLLENSKESLFKSTIDYLAKDGLPVDVSSKEYDINKADRTFGSKSRQLFLTYNQTIDSYQSILKVLKGEERCNITESIPAIDFLNKENTSLLSTYVRDLSTNELDSSVITPAPDSKNLTAMDIINNKDAFIINRAVMGEPIAEHFYNTTKERPREPNIQVGSTNGNYGYKYKSIKGKNMVDTDGNPYGVSRTASIYITQIGRSNQMIRYTIYNPDSPKDGNFNPGSRDNYGYLVPDTSSQVGGSTFIKGTGKSYEYNLMLSEGDIVVSIPGSLYSVDITRLLLLKKNVNRAAGLDDNGDPLEEGSAAADAPVYEPFIIYIRTMTATFDMQTINVDDNLPGYVNDSAIIDPMKSYLNIIKEYYGVVSGFLNGYFCVPRDYEEGYVTRWAFENHQEEASKKGVNIDIGSRYNPAHLLGRGVPIIEPLGLTAGDKSNGGGWDNNGKAYYGKATLIFDKLLKSTQALFTSVLVDKSKWYDFPLIKVDSVLKKADFEKPVNTYKNIFERFSRRNQEVIKYPLKLRNPENNAPLSSKAIKKYIQACADSIQELSDGTYMLNLDFKNKSSTYCCDMNVRENGTFFNFGWIASNTGHEGEGNIIETSPTHVAYASWTLHYKWKRKGVRDYCNNLSVKVASPINMFSKKLDPYLFGRINSASMSSSYFDGEESLDNFYSLLNKNFQNDHSFNIPGVNYGDGVKSFENAILVYPENNDTFPDELYLISRADLKLEVYDPSYLYDLENPTSSRGLCCFYNPKDNGKVICFRVDQKAAFLPSKVSKIKITDPYGNVYTRPAHSVGISKEVSEVEDEDGNIHTVFERGEVTNATIKGGTWNDCYIYTLKPMILSLDGVYIRDFNDNIIDASDGVNDVILTPMSYPAGFFKCNAEVNPNAGKPDEPQYIYRVDYNHRQKDITYLEDAYIVSSLPKYDSVEELATLTKDGVDLSIFKDLIVDGIDSVLNQMLRQSVSGVLEKWPLSDSSSNAIKLKEFPEILQGIKEIKPHMERLIEEGFTVPVSVPNSDGSRTTKDIAIDAEDMNPLFKRITTSSKYQEWAYRLVGSIDNNTIQNAINKFIPGGEDYNPYTDSSNEKSSQLLSEVLNTILPGVFSIEKDNSKEPYTYNRPSLEKMAEVVNSTLGSSAVISREGCQLLDNIFGESAGAFLELGEIVLPDKSTNNISIMGSTPTSILNSSSGYTEAIRGVITRADSLIKDTLVKVKVETPIKNIYKKFFGGTINLGSPMYKADVSSNSLNLPEGNNWKSGIDTYELMNELKNNRGIHSWFWGINIWVNKWRNLSFYDFAKFLGLYYVNGNLASIPDNRWSIFGPKPRDPWCFRYVTWGTRKKMRNYLLTRFRQEAKAKCESQSKILFDTEMKDLGLLSEDAIEDFIYNDNKGNFLVNEDRNPEGTIGQTTYTIKLPNYIFNDGKTNYGSIVTSSLDTSGATPQYDIKPADTSFEILNSVLDYVEGKLKGEGTAEESVRYIEGDSSTTGRPNSLYYKRYEALNDRMNTNGGNLFKAAFNFRTKKYVDSQERYLNNKINLYSKFMSVLPMDDMTPLSYFSPQQASASLVELDGKFYYQKELNALKEAIGDRCVLTCNSCPVKDSCIFYNEKEILKLYCSEARSVDFYVKDNMLDFIYYDESNDPEVDSPHLVSEDGDDEKIPAEFFKNKHKKYANILSKKLNTNNESIDYEVRDIKDIEDEIKAAFPDTFDVDGKNGFGWLIGGRYGTIQRNPAIELSGGEKEFEGEEFPLNNYLFDAVFVKDQKSEILYSPSNTRYNVSLRIPSPKTGNIKTYSGSTKIYIPRTLSILDNADDNDDVYIVSDDNIPGALPIIYVNKVKNVEIAFDLNEDPPEKELSISDIEYDEFGKPTPKSGHVYAKDVAQWNINIAKGINKERFKGEVKSTDPYNKDQYWMKNIKKEVLDRNGNKIWIDVPGRLRKGTGFAEITTSPEKFDTAFAISGKPPAVSYENFMRKVMLRMSCIQWVLPEVSTLLERDVDGSINDNSLRNAINKQKSVFAQMKTNLRLVVVRDSSNVNMR